MTAAITETPERLDEAIGWLFLAAVAVERAGATRIQVQEVMRAARLEARRLEKASRPPLPPPVCPSESRYRQHLAAGESCGVCRPYMAEVERERKARGPGAVSRVNAWWPR